MHRQPHLFRLVAVGLVAMGFLGAVAIATPAAEAGRSSRGGITSIGGP